MSGVWANGSTQAWGTLSLATYTWERKESPSLEILFVGSAEKCVRIKIPRLGKCMCAIYETKRLGGKN